MTEDEPTMKDKLEFMKSLGELMDLIKEVKPGLAKLVKIMDGQADGTNRGAWFEAVDKVTELDEDDTAAMLLIAVATISKVRVAVRDTAMEKELRELVGLDEPEVAAQES